MDQELDTFARLDLVAFLEACGWKVVDRDRRYTKMHRAGANGALMVSQMPSGVWVWNTRDGMQSGRMIWDYLQTYEGAGSIGHARVVLRDHAGTERPERPRDEAPQRPARTAAAAANSNGGPKEKDFEAVRRRWASFDAGSAYLLGRGISAEIVAAFVGDIRTDRAGNACCAHRLLTGEIVGYEIKGPRRAGQEGAKRSYTAFSAGGSKSIFRIGQGPVQRLVVAEAAIDALSVAEHEGLRQGTRYCSLYGEPGPTNVETLQAIARRFPGRSWVLAFDVDGKGEGFAAQVRAIVGSVDPTASFETAALPASPDPLRPYKDWNEAICPAEYAARLRREAARAA